MSNNPKIKNQPDQVQKFLLWIVLFLVVLGLGLSVRFYPLSNPLWSDSNEQATALVINRLRGVIAKEILSTSNHLSDKEKNKLIEEKFASTLKNDSVMVKKTIQSVAQSLRQTASNKNHNYLQEIDGYYYYDLTQTIQKTGNISSQIKGSKFFHDKMAAPFGFWQPINAHPFVGFYVYKIIQALKPDVTLMFALSFVGPILSAIALFAFIWVCRILKLSALATFIGAVYFYLAPIFVKRSTFAWYDDDSYNLIFPLLILGIAFKAIEEIRNYKQALLYSLCCALTFMTYAFFWHGWGFTFIVLLTGGLLAGIITSYVIKNNVPTVTTPKTSFDVSRAILVFLVMTTAGTLFLMSLIFGPNDFITVFHEGFTGLQKLTVNKLSIWPNLFIAVGELNRSSLQQILDMTGNIFWAASIGAGIILAGYGAHQKRDKKRASQLIILCVLLAADLAISLGAQRFILLCLIPMALLATIGMESIISSLNHFFFPPNIQQRQNKLIPWILGILLALGAIIAPVRSINAQIPSLMSAIFNPTWEQALLDIKNKTPQDSIITSWWSPGHFIKAIAQRRVTFDGATITENQQAYWVANAFLTSDENKAAGILRMLNTSGTQAMNYLLTAGMKTSDAVSLLDHILALNQKDAAALLVRNMQQERIDQLLKFTHAPPPPSYLLIYSELMEKNIGLQFVAKWNFRKIEDINANPQILNNLPPANSPAFFDYLWKTMGGPYKYSEALVSIAQNEDIIDFDQGVRINLKAMTASIHSAKYGSGVPQSIIYLNNGRVIEQPELNPTLNYSIVLFQENSRYYCRLMDRELANSLLVKMYFFRGQGLTLFKPLSMHSSVTGKDEIFIFELDRSQL